MSVCRRRLVWAAVLLVTAIVPVADGDAAPPDLQKPAPESCKRYAADIERNLHETIVGFWLPRSIDRQYGGYRINFDRQGAPNGKTSKGLVTQARMVWFWSRMLRAGLDGPKFQRNDYRAAAEHGFRFLRDRFHDPVHGGYFWEIDQSGKQVLRPNKHLYGQAFALYALSEYCLATGDAQALELANALFDILERRAHDARHGGYREYFAPDWGPAPADQPNYLDAANVKLMNTHLHLMEALTTYVAASQRPLARTRLAELIEIQSNAVVRKAHGCCTDKHRDDWTPMLDPPYNVVSYGHDIENVWLLVDARRALGLPQAPLVDLYRTLWDYSLRFGLDAERGGLYDSGPIGAAATGRGKAWWVQAELLVSALRMHQLTGDPRYAAVFEQTWRFIDRDLTDHKQGEWFAGIAADGSVQGDKGHLWKAGYHNGRALVEVLAALKR